MMTATIDTTLSPMHTNEQSHTRVDEHALDALFRQARTNYAWLPEPVSEETLRELYDLLKWGPTSANSSPLRVLFLTSEEAKARVLPALSANNVEKSRTAPVVALIAYDMEFTSSCPSCFRRQTPARGLPASRK